MSMVKSNELLESPESLSFNPIIQAPTQTFFALLNYSWFMCIPWLGHPGATGNPVVVYFHVRSHIY